MQWEIDNEQLDLKIKLQSVFERTIERKKIIGFSVSNLFTINFFRFGLIIFTYFRYMLILYKKYLVYIKHHPTM
jgi:hypothetical protein